MKSWNEENTILKEKEMDMDMSTVYRYRMTVTYIMDVAAHSKEEADEILSEGGWTVDYAIAANGGRDYRDSYMGEYGEVSDLSDCDLWKDEKGKIRSSHYNGNID